MDKNSILDRYKDYEDRILVNNLINLAETCIKGYTYKATSFLDPRQQAIAESVLDRFDEAAYYFDGGIENAERSICVIHNEELDMEEVASPVEILEIKWAANSFSAKGISHRDVLGSLMGNGIKREMIGDIILEDEKAFVACTREIAQYILSYVSKIGRYAVHIGIAETACKNEEKCKTIDTTVASLRLDSILGSGFGVSRAKAADAVKAGKVKLNWEEVLSPSKEVKLGDVISLRGRGRISLDEINGNTRKDRIRIVIKKYI